MNLTVPINDNQLQLVDQVVADDDVGKSRQEVLCAALKEHLEHLAAGGSPYDLGGLGDPRSQASRIRRETLRRDPRARHR